METKAKTCGRCGGTGIEGGRPSKANIPTPHGCYLSECILGWYVFIPRHPKSISGVSVRYKTRELALADYPNAEARNAK